MIFSYPFGLPNVSEKNAPLRSWSAQRQPRGSAYSEKDYEQAIFSQNVA
jgi:hypothetical protein